MSGSHTPLPELLSSEIVYHGFFDVQVDLLKFPSGVKQSYTVLNTGLNAAAVIAQTADGRLIINKEYRHPTKHWLLSCPGGRIDKGESPGEAGRRELLEETGYTAEGWREIGMIFPFPAATDQRIHFFFAKNARKVQPPQLESSELIETMLKTPDELFREIAAGQPVDGVLCAALLLYTRCAQ